MVRADTPIRHSIVAIVGIVSCLFWYPFAGKSEEVKTVTVFPSERHRPFFSRLRAEIQIAGFYVRESPERGVPDETTVASVLRTSCAVLFVHEKQGIVELYYRTKDNQKAHLEVPLPRNNEEEQLTSLYLAEVLRVSSIRPQQSPPPSTPRRSPAQKKTTDYLSAQLGTAVLFGDLGAPPQAGLYGCMGIRLMSRLQASFHVDLPIWGIHIHEPEGDARIFMGELGLSLGIVANTKIFKPMARLGYQLWLFGAKSNPASGFDGTTSTELTSGPVLYAGGTFVLKGRMGVALGATVAVTTNKIDYRISTRPVVTVGRPMLGIALGVAWLPAERKR